MSKSIDLDHLYPVFWEDLYEKPNYVFRYELIRVGQVDRISEYKVIIDRDMKTMGGTVALYYQTAGNGFKLWHRFRIQEEDVLSQVGVQIEDYRYAADRKILLYLNKRNVKEYYPRAETGSNFTLPLFG